MSEQTRDDTAGLPEFDVLIIGAGAAGACAAHVLSAQGLSVCIVDSHDQCAPCFKAEKLEPDQVELLQGMHLMPLLGEVLSPLKEVVIYKRRAVVERFRINQFGMHYHGFVNALRGSLPPQVTRVTGTVTALHCSEARQTATLAKGTTISARLAVVSAGTGSRLRHSLGVQRQEVAAHHSIAFGFDVNLAAGRLPHDGVNFIPDRFNDRIGFLTLFPTPAGVRANLFCYQDPQSAWSSEMRRNAGAVLDRSFSNMRHVLGDYEVTGRVSGAAIDLWTTIPGTTPGVVLIGDSFQSVCPATGTGISKVLTDVHVLGELAPAWLRTPGMPAAKIASFYEHSRKRSTDRGSLDSAAYSRRMATDRSLRFRLTRLWHKATGWRRASTMLRSDHGRPASAAGDAGSALQLPWDRLPAADRAPEPSCLEFDLPSERLSEEILLGALLLQLDRYGNVAPAVKLVRDGGRPSSVSLAGVDIGQLTGAALAAMVQQRLLQPANARPAATLQTGARDFDQACRDAEMALAAREELLRFVLSSDSRKAVLVHDTASLTAETAARIAAHFNCLVSELVDRSGTRAAELRMVPAAEAARIEAACQGGPAPPALDFLEMFERSVRTRAQSDAVVYRDRHISYAELDAAATRIAGGLSAAGVRAGDRVVTALEPGPWGAACIIGMLRLRAVYVPVDPGYPAARIATMLADCAARVAIVGTRAPELPEGVRLLQVEELVREDAVTADRPAPGAAADAAYVFYTSGTTGTPKGVLASRGNLAHYIGAAVDVYGLRAGDVLPCLARATFSISLFEILAPLACGATSVVLDRDHVLDMTRLAAALRNVTVFHAGPSLMRNLLAHVAATDADYRFPGVRHASAGGDLVPPELLEQMRARFPAAEIYVIYGCSEISVMGCTWRVPDHGPVDRTFVGAPFPGVSIRVLDAQRRQVPLGVAGEVYFAGAGVIAGYLNRDALTAERFSVIDGQRFYNTGDVGRLSGEGLLQLLGRLDFQVQLRGMRVELGEVEHALRQFPGVRDGVVAARPDADGELQLVAYYVPQSGEVEPAALRAHFLSRLPDYMVPVIYCPLEKLPLNANLKVDRKALPDPPRVTRAVASNSAAELSGTQARLAAVWRDVIRVEGVRPEDDFFLLGGTSLGVMRLITRIATDFGVEIAASDVFREATLRSLAAFIDARAASPRGVATTAIARLGERARGAPQPLSAAQERMWFWTEMAPDVALYNVPILTDIEGPVDESRLRAALTALLRRHEVLRTGWRTAGGKPMQQVTTDDNWPLRVERVYPAVPKSAAAESAALLRQEALRPIDPGRELPVRGLLIHVGGERSTLLLTLHHSVCDGWSTEIVLRDLWSLYRAPEDPGLPALPVQYLDFAAWESRWLAAGARTRELAYWTRQLAGAPDVIDLPADRPRSATPRYRGALLAVRFDAAETAALRALATRNGATLFMVLLAVWQSLLFRLSRQATIVTGSVIAHRGRGEIDELIGYFANTVALRADFTPQLTAAGLLQQTRTTALGAYDNQSVPFEEVVDALKLRRDPSRIPLIQTFLELQPPIDPAPAVAGLSLHRRMLDAPVAKFDLSLELQEVGQELHGFFEYDVDLFDASTIERWEGYLHVLATGMCRDESRPVGALPLLSDHEREMQLITWNATARPYDNAIPVCRRFEQQAARDPAATAVVLEGARLTYGELNARANQLARELQARGAGRDVPIGVCMERSFELVVAIMGIHKAGAVYVPLDPDLPAERLAFMARDCAFPVILTQVHLERDQAGWRQPGCAVLRLDADWPLLGKHSTADLSARCGPDDLAYIIYTSGSTGHPKGVEIPHRGLNNHINWMEEAMACSARDRLLQKTTISFDASVADFMLPLQIGATIVLATPGGHRDLGYLIDLMQKEQVTITMFVPSALRIMADEPALARCTSLRHLIVGGEALDWETARRVQALLPGTVVGNFYGPSEASDDSTHFPVPRNAGHAGLVPIGRPIANVQCHVLDDGGQLCAIGVPGELHVAGQGLARGYRNRQDLTAERFIHSPEVPGVRLYRTGDVVRRSAEGLIEFLGRADHQIKLRGFRIELDEIESALRNVATPRQCAVVARKASSGEPLIVAYLVGSPVSHDTVRDALLARLPEYMVPAAFVDLAELPVLPNGKLDRKALPEPTLAIPARALIAPRNDTEQMVAGVFAEALGQGAISVTDNFFDLGGHSLLASRIMLQLRGRTGLTLPLRTLFEHPTAAGLANAIDASRWDARESLDRKPSETGREEFEL